MVKYEKISQAMKKLWQNQVYRKKMSVAFKKRSADPKYKCKRVEIAKKQWEKQRKRLVIAYKKKYAKPEMREKMRKIVAKHWRTISEEKRKDRIVATMRGNRKKPTVPERKMLFIVKSLGFQYTGNGVFIVGGRCPDFINHKSKKIIEVYGDYWHSQYVTGKPEKQEEQDRIDHFRKYGFDCLVIWERELKDLDNVRKKINSFA